jgi:hypothetical protein
VSLSCSPPLRLPLDGRTRSHGADGSAAQERGSSPPLRTVRVALVAAAPRSTLAGEAARAGGARAGPVELVVVPAVEELVEVDGAVVVGDEAGTVELAAPATTGPP